MNPLTDEILKELEVKAEASLPGPWTIADGYDGSGIGVYGMGMEIANVQETLPETAAYIAAASPSTVLAMIREIRESRALLERALPHLEFALGEHIEHEDQNDVKQIIEALLLRCRPHRPGGPLHGSTESGLELKK